MAHREPLGEQEPTIGKLVVDAIDDAGALLRQIIELAKSELRVSVRAGGMAIALFLLAGFISLLAIIMVSIAIAFSRFCGAVGRYGATLGSTSLTDDWRSGPSAVAVASFARDSVEVAWRMKSCAAFWFFAPFTIA